MHKKKTHITNLNPGRTRQPADAILAELLQKIFGDRPGPILIAVGGPGGTGKSTFCKALSKRLPDAVKIRLDDYKTPRQARRDQNLFGAHPGANHMAMIREHLEALKNRRTIHKPVYNSVTGEAKETREVHPRRFIILDGEISTYAEFRSFIDFAIFIDSDWTTQLNTRISRDIEVRGYTRDKAIATFLQSNLREFTKYGAESKNWADVHLYSHDDYHIEIESVSDELFDPLHDQIETSLAALDFAGLVVATLTPFTDNYELAPKAFINHLEFLAGHGVKRILVNGTTGEFFSLTPEERKLLLTLARRYFPGVVMLQAGSDSLAQTLEAVKWGEKYGADAVAALPPYYLSNAPRKGLIEYFRRLAESTHLPLLLYNFPKHTNNPLDAGLLREIPHFGLKDSSATLELQAHTPHYYIGNDRRILESHRRGGYGFISGVANLYPEPFVKLDNACRAQDYDAAEKYQSEICEISESFADNYIARLKAALKTRLPGYPQAVRPPLITL